MKWVFKLAGNAILGLAALFLFNFVANNFGMSLGINVLNTAAVGILGVPGFALLLVLQTMA